MMTLLGAMAPGADSIDDCQIPRVGRIEQALGQAATAPSTLGTFLRGLTFADVRVGPRPRPGDRPGLGRRGRPGRSSGGRCRSFVREVHGYRKQGGAFAHTRQRGHHPLWRPAPTPARCCTSGCAAGGPTPPAGRCASSRSCWRGSAVPARRPSAFCAPTRVLVDRPLCAAGAGRLALLDRGAAAPDGAPGDRGDPGGRLEDAHRRPADRRGPDRRDQTGRATPRGAPGAHARRPGGAAGRLRPSALSPTATSPSAWSRPSTAITPSVS